MAATVAPCSLQGRATSPHLHNSKLLQTIQSPSGAPRLGALSKGSPSTARRARRDWPTGSSSAAARPLVVRAAGAPKRPPAGEGEPKMDWDKSWRAFKAAKANKRQNPFQFMEKYVSRSPTSSKFPMMEEVDEFRKTEKSALNVWTSPNFTYAGVGVLVGLFVYMVIIVGPPPTH